jgi:hypothetical protein
MNQRNGRALAFVLGALTVVLIAAALISARQNSNKDFHTVSQAAAAIRSELPQGSSRKSVMNWLDARRIPNTFDANKRQEIAILHDARKDATTRSDLRMVFNFDKDERLSAFVVEELTAERHNDEGKEPLLD